MLQRSLGTVSVLALTLCAGCGESTDSGGSTSTAGQSAAGAMGVAGNPGGGGMSNTAGMGNGMAGMAAVDMTPPPQALLDSVTTVVNDFSVPAMLGTAFDPNVYFATGTPSITGGIATFTINFPAITTTSTDAAGCAVTQDCSAQVDWNFPLPASMTPPADVSGMDAIIIARVVSGYDPALVLAGTLQGAIQPTSSSVSSVDPTLTFAGFTGGFTTLTTPPWAPPTAWTAYSVPLVAPGTAMNFDPTMVQQIGFQIFYQVNPTATVQTVPAGTVVVQVALAGLSPSAM